MTSPAPNVLSDLAQWTASPASDPITRRARFAALLEANGEHLDARTTLKVTGTNGKGSTCAMLEAALQSAGLRVGLFTSPHLFHVTERFRVDGRDVAEPLLERHAGEVARIARALVERRGDAFRPALFEVLTLAAIRIFREAAVDVAIFEGGVGGRSDPVGHIPADLSIITNVARDHLDRLGGTLEAIAADKAGMAHDGTRLVLGPGIEPSHRAVIEADALPRGVTLLPASRARVTAIRYGARPTSVEIDGRIRFDLPLIGDHQIDNLATVVTAMESLVEQRVAPSLDCLRGIARVRWAGRAEIHEGAPRLLFDVAHNDDGMRALAALVDDIAPRDRRVLLYGAGAAKDYEACLPYLPRLAPTVLLAEGFHSAASARAIADALPDACRCAGILPTPAAALAHLATLDAGVTVIVTGSVFLVGEIRHRVLSCP